MMMRKSGLTIAAALAATLAVTMTDTALAQAYPSRPVKIVVPFAAGGSTDVVARLVAQGMTKTIGQQVIVENRTGGGGIIGSDAVAKAEPDGYTILAATVSTHAINPALYAKLPFDVKQDFAPVTHLVNVPNVLVVHPSVPAKMADFKTWVAANAAKASYASPGNGSIGHLQGHWFANLLKVDIAHVPYRGAGPAMQDLIGGQVQLMIDNVPTSLGHIRSGAVKALLVSSEQRIPQLPDVPSAPEVGLPDFIGYSWVALLAPAKTPAAIVAKINQAAVEALGDPALKERLSDLSATVVAGGSEATAKLLATEQAKWAPIVKATGATAN
ncbi:tripartite tricarboxylate transporter substrate binding protein [Ferrovibrio terrae]|uniref:Bug family tripartite tricarboxylate transporter substrate binding protein n=1 Tax=Ferrovibrio terrae TaxID=2594003 RepID=UPI0031380FFE